MALQLTVCWVVALLAVACSSPASTTTLQPDTSDLDEVVVPACEGALGEKLRGEAGDRAWEATYARSAERVWIRVDNHTLNGVAVRTEHGRLGATFGAYQELMLVTAQLTPGLRMLITTLDGEVVIPCRFAVGPLQTSLVVAVFPHVPLQEVVIVDDGEEVVWEVDEPTLADWANSAAFGSEFDIGR
ncbi:MAG TPA: hypothetical protein VJR05_08765 [Acidimicrobiia bacterium]|nr:hypothetical protein [Acidimicrobiia bacterium]